MKSQAMAIIALALLASTARAQYPQPGRFAPPPSPLTGEPLPPGYATPAPRGSVRLPNQQYLPPPNQRSFAPPNQRNAPPPRGGVAPGATLPGPPAATPYGRRASGHLMPPPRQFARPQRPKNPPQPAYAPRGQYCIPPAAANRVQQPLPPPKKWGFIGRILHWDQYQDRPKSQKEIDWEYKFRNNG